ncbi:MAG: nicotinate-nucleotide--dimethylbenzimidazole phosphoribosyltransferase [Candidatus Geothermarchaeales archaeon]
MQRIRDVIAKIKPLDAEAMREAKERQDSLTKPRESLGVLEDLSIRVAGIKGEASPSIREKAVITMAGDHGVVEEGVSAYPMEVTRQMVRNFVGGGAGINVLARHVGSRVVVVDMGVAADINEPHVINRKVNYGTKNMAKEPAMMRDEAIGSIEAGIEVFMEELKRGMDIVGIGDMGIGNTTASSAIVACITGEPVRRVTGRGTGVDDSTFERKVRVIERALKVNRPNPKDPVDVLAKVGGFEIGGLVGVVLAGAAHRVPVVVDGFITGASALIATELAPQARDYLIAAHLSVERGHKIILDRMGLRPLLDLEMRLGEGTGAAIGISLTEAACKVLSEMATFAEAKVSEALERRR